MSSQPHHPSPAVAHPDDKTDINGDAMEVQQERGKAASEDPVPKDAKPGLLSRIWAAIDLQWFQLLVMAKGGLPPAIALAMYQSTPVAETYTTLGYLIAISSILGFAIMPRARFIQGMLLNVLAVCLGAAVALLTIYCTTQARLHTEAPAATRPSGAQAPTPGTTLVKYNASASAVAAIWLFFQIYLVNVFRAKLPQLMMPTIIYSIFSIVACVYSSQFPTMPIGITFVKRLLETFLTGFAIATAVSFVVFPTSVRTVVFADFTNYFSAISKSLDAHRAYLFAMETPDAFAREMTIDEEGGTSSCAEAKVVRQSVAGIVGLHGKLQGDLTFAKREIALGQLGPDDFKEMNKLIRSVTLPILGLGAMINIFEKIANLYGWTKAHLDHGLSGEEQEHRDRTIREWNKNMEAIHDTVDSFVEVLKEGIEHVQLQLQLKKRPKNKKQNSRAAKSGAEDIEASAESTKPGEQGFAAYFEKKISKLHDGKHEALREYCVRRGIDLPSNFFDHPDTAPFEMADSLKHETYHAHQIRQRQLYGILYIEFLLYGSCRAMVNFIKFADDKVESGKMSRTHLIFPGFKRLRKWALSMSSGNNSAEDTGLHDLQTSTYSVSMGQAYNRRKDPEHLPPTNALEKLGDTIRIIPAALRSPESAFGFRVAVATMCIAIVAFLESTQVFFTQNRLLWAMIMVAISMTPTAGQSVFSFVLRIFGTVVAMIVAYLVYYIPDGHTAGMIVFLWFFSSLAFYIVIKTPQYTVVGIVSIITTTLIIGYELEARKIGTQAAASNGQKYLPINTLAPYRLATVVGGLFVAWVWTIFPYPIAEHSQLRQDAGRTLYLLANFYSTIHETVASRIRDENDLDYAESPVRMLEKQRVKVYSKVVLMLDSLRTHIQFLKWELPIGGRFPKKQYEVIADVANHVVNYIALIGYASQTFTSSAKDQAHSQWSQDFRHLMASAGLTSHEITSLLSLLSASIRNAQALPPYLTVPKPYGLSDKLEKMDPDILSVRHMAEPGYAAFAVIQISSRCIVADLERLLRAVKDLVGELDFSFHVVSTEANSMAGSNESLDRRNKLD